MTGDGERSMFQEEMTRRVVAMRSRLIALAERLDDA